MSFSNNSEPIRVLQSVGAMNHGGIEHFIMNIYRKIDRDKVQFDFLERVNVRCVFDDEIESLGGKIYRCASPDRHLVSSERFYREFFKGHPEYRIVHEHRSTLSGFLGCLRAAASAHVPTRIVHSHNSSLAAWHGGLGNQVEAKTDKWNKKRIRQIATDYFACSEAAREWMFPPSGRCRDLVRIIPNGIDTGRFAFDADDRLTTRKELGIPIDALCIGHVGRFSKEKNQIFLVEMIASIPQEKRPYLVLLGDGATRPAIEGRAEELQVRDRVVFCGLQDETCRFYSAMDVFCMPSIHEGLPVSAVEAQASGLPLLLADGISRDTDLGGDVQFKSLDDGAEAWGSVLLDKLAAHPDRSKGQQVVKSAGFDITAVALELQNFYMSRGER